MVFVDTSVWVGFFRGRDSKLTARLQDLLDRDEVALAAPVRLEILSGSSGEQFSPLRRNLSALPLYYPSRDTWALVESWIHKAVRAGQRFGLGDLLIGAIAAERGGTVWSLDADFSRLARLGVLELVTVRARKYSGVVG